MLNKENVSRLHQVTDLLSWNKQCSETEKISNFSTSLTARCDADNTPENRRVVGLGGSECKSSVGRSLVSLKPTTALPSDGALGLRDILHIVEMEKVSSLLSKHTCTHTHTRVRLPASPSHLGSSAALRA